MNIELINKRKLQVETAIKKTNEQIQQLMSNLNMLEGGRQECIFWLNEINKSPANEMKLEELKEYLGADSIEVIDKEEIAP